MRLFFAVNFNEETKNRILNVQEELRSRVLRGSFTRPENFHLTLAFLGETPAEKLPLLFRVLRELRFTPFELAFNRAGFFGRNGSELWWIGAGRESPGLPELETLRGRLPGLLSEAGFPLPDSSPSGGAGDPRPFRAHITLGRGIVRSGALALGCPEFTVTVERVSLMKSERLRGVLTYTEISGTAG